MNIIDSHQHFWKFDAQKHSWITEDMQPIRRNFLPYDLLPVLERNEVMGCVAVQVEHNEKETRFLLNCAAKHDFIKGVVGWTDLSAFHIRDRLQDYSDRPEFKGVRHTEYDEKGEFLLKPGFRNGIKALQEFDLSFDLLVFPYQLAAALELVKDFPQQSFVLDHLAKPRISEGPTHEWVEYMKQLGKCENLCAKLSGMVTETEKLNWKQGDFRPFLDVMLEAFGTERLMFGSDWPVCTNAASYEEVLGILRSYFEPFSKEERQAVFGANAMRIYRL